MILHGGEVVKLRGLTGARGKKQFLGECAVCSVQCALHTVHCKLCTVHCAHLALCTTFTNFTPPCSRSKQVGKSQGDLTSTLCEGPESRDTGRV